MKRLAIVAYNWATKLFPDFSLTALIRQILLRFTGAQIGSGLILGPRVFISGLGTIKIGDHVVIGSDVKIVNFGTIQISNNTSIFDDVYIKCKSNSTILIGDNCEIATGVLIESGGVVSIGNRTGVWQQCILTANGGSSLIIGKDCKIAHRSSLKTTTHQINPDGVCIGDATNYKNIVVGNGCWICANSIVLPGVCLGEKCLVAAGGVVTKDAPPYSLMAGVPAVCKKKYELNT